MIPPTGWERDRIGKGDGKTVREKRQGTKSVRFTKRGKEAQLRLLRNKCPNVKEETVFLWKEEDDEEEEEENEDEEENEEDEE